MTMADNWIKDIIAMLEKEASPEEICSEMGLCAVKRFRVSKKSNDIHCDLCMQVVNYVEKLVLKELFEEEIIKLVNEGCAQLPAPLSTYCRDFCDQWIREIVGLLEQGVAVLDICGKIGLC
jgi:saposin